MFGQRELPLGLPEDGRLVVPVLAPTGGAGRSTVAGLLGAALSRAGRTLLIDTAEHLSSPWSFWVDHAGAGSASIGDMTQPRSAEVFAACSSLTPGHDCELQVLTDVREPLAEPWLTDAGPRWPLTALTAGGFRSAVVDTALPMTRDLATALHARESTPTLGWLTAADVVPVVCVPTSGGGLEHALAAITLVEALDLSARNLVLALVGIAPGGLPRRARASLALLEHRVGPIVEIPYDSRVRAVGLRGMAKLARRTRQAGEELARAVLTVAESPTPWVPTQPPASLDSERIRDEPAVSRVAR